RGETQLHLNFKTGIAQGYLSDLESGRRTGTRETIAKLAQALNVPAEWLSQPKAFVLDGAQSIPVTAHSIRPARPWRRAWQWGARGLVREKCKRHAMTGKRPFNWPPVARTNREQFLDNNGN